MKQSDQSGPFSIENYQQNTKPNAKLRKMKWNHTQIVKYAIFIDYYQQNTFTKEEFLEKGKFFRLLSLFIQTKNCNQCRILHNHFIARYKNFQQIIINLQSSIQHFQREKYMLKNSLENVIKCVERQVQPTRLRCEIKLEDNKNYEKIQKHNFLRKEQDSAIIQISDDDDLNSQRSYQKQKGYKKTGLQSSSLEVQKFKMNMNDFWYQCHNSFLKYVHSLKK